MASDVLTPNQPGLLEPVDVGPLLGPDVHRFIWVRRGYAEARNVAVMNFTH